MVPNSVCKESLLSEEQCAFQQSCSLNEYCTAYRMQFNICHNAECPWCLLQCPFQSSPCCSPHTQIFLPAGVGLGLLVLALFALTPANNPKAFFPFPAHFDPFRAANPTGSGSSRAAFPPFAALSPKGFPSWAKMDFVQVSRAGQALLGLVWCWDKAPG